MDVAANTVDVAAGWLLVVDWRAALATAAAPAPEPVAALAGAAAAAAVAVAAAPAPATANAAAAAIVLLLLLLLLLPLKAFVACCLLDQATRMYPVNNLSAFVTACPLERPGCCRSSPMALVFGLIRRCI